MNELIHDQTMLTNMKKDDINMRMCINILDRMMLYTKENDIHDDFIYYAIYCLLSNFLLTIPKYLLTQKVANISIKINPLILKDLPIQFRNKFMYSKYVETLRKINERIRNKGIINVLKDTDELELFNRYNDIKIHDFSQHVYVPGKNDGYINNTYIQLLNRQNTLVFLEMCEFMKIIDEFEAGIYTNLLRYDFEDFSIKMILMNPSIIKDKFKNISALLGNKIVVEEFIIKLLSSDNSFIFENIPREYHTPEICRIAYYQNINNIILFDDETKKNIMDEHIFIGWTPSLHHRICTNDQIKIIETLYLIKNTYMTCLSNIPPEIMFHIFDIYIVVDH